MRTEQEEPGDIPTEGVGEGVGAERSRAGRPAAAEGWGRPSHLALPCPRVPSSGFPCPSGHLTALGEEEAWELRGQGMVMTRWPRSTPFPSTNTWHCPGCHLPRAGSLLSL